MIRGDFRYLGRRFSLAVDNLEEVEMVTAPTAKCAPPAPLCLQTPDHLSPEKELLSSSLSPAVLIPVCPLIELPTGPRSE